MGSRQGSLSMMHRAHIRTEALEMCNNSLRMEDHHKASALRNSLRLSLSVLSTSATISGETRPIFPIHWKNFLNEVADDLVLVTEAHNAFRGNQSTKNIQTSSLLASSSFFNGSLRTEIGRKKVTIDHVVIDGFLAQT